MGSEGCEGRWHHDIAHGTPFHHRVMDFHLLRGKLGEGVSGVSLYEY